MARTRRNQYRSSILPSLMMGGTAIGLLGLAGLTVAWAMGAFSSETEQEADRTGQLAFPALARPVSAFESISREHLINPQTGQLNVSWLPESTAEVASRSVGDLLGRVLARDKAAGMVLTERDFLPEGTKPGVSAGIPPGKFAVTIPTTGIPGLEQLRHGDRFDLMVSLGEQSDDEEKRSNTEPAAVFGGIKPPSLRVGQLSQQYGVKRLVTGGQLVALAQGNQHSTKGRSGLTTPPPRGRSSTMSETYAEIAIDEEEIGPLTEAISLEKSMTCIVRSGRPDAEIEEAFSRDGLVPVITTATTVDAYGALTDESLIDSATGQLHFYYFPPQRVPEHWLTEPTAVYGRVVSRTLRRGSPITEADLLPLGTKPGISAGVPPGMVAMAIQVSKLSGFGDLVQGDRFAIHAKVPESTSKPVNSSWAMVQGGTLSSETQRLERMLSSGIREVVPTAIYLRRSEDGSATIAVPNDRIAEVAQLIRDELELFVVAKSVNEDKGGDENMSTQSLAPAPITLVAAQSASGNPNADKQMADNQIQVPILTRDVDPFAPLQVDDFIDPTTGQIRFVFFPESRVRADWQTDVSQLIDRVTRRALRAGRTVSIDDLAPPGSPAGPSAGVPVGMEGVLVDSAQIEDLDLVGPGAKFDIVSSRAIQPSQLGDRVRRTLSSADAVAEADKLPNLNIAVSRTVAVGAVLLAEFDSTDRTERSILTDRTITRTTLLGGIEEVQTAEQPRVETDTRTVKRFAIAVPKSQAATLISFLNRDTPLRVVLGNSVPDPTTLESSLPSLVTDTPAINTFVREHFNGSEEPTTEVFVSDRRYPVNSNAADVGTVAPLEFWDLPNE